MCLRVCPTSFLVHNSLGITTATGNCLDCGWQTQIWISGAFLNMVLEIKVPILAIGAHIVCILHCMWVVDRATQFLSSNLRDNHTRDLDLVTRRVGGRQNWNREVTILDQIILQQTERPGSTPNQSTPSHISGTHTATSTL